MIKLSGLFLLVGCRQAVLGRLPTSHRSCKSHALIAWNATNIPHFIPGKNILVAFLTLPPHVKNNGQQDDHGQWGELSELIC